MENAVDALKMAFAVFVFVIALTISITVLTQARAVSEVVLYMSDKTNFYETLDENQLNKYNSEGRIVGIETIIPTLYRYYKENFTVVIRNKEKEIIELFDTNIESIMYNQKYTYDGNVIKLKNASNSDIKLNTIYSRINSYGINSIKNDEQTINELYPNRAPWMGNANKDTKARVDAFVNGGTKTINTKTISYSSSFLSTYKDKKFLETYEEYRYSGQVMKEEEEELEIVKGNTKVIITYTLQ